MNKLQNQASYTNDDVPLAEQSLNTEQIVTHAFNSIKIVSAIFLLAGVLLAVFCGLWLHNSPKFWLILGMYTWSVGFFLIYLITRSVKRLKRYHGKI